MHIKFTQMVGAAGGGYIENKSIWIPVEVLKQSIVYQEKECYSITLPKSETYYGVEVVKENPIELLESYEQTQDARMVSFIRKLNKGSIV